MREQFLGMVAVVGLCLAAPGVATAADGAVETSMVTFKGGAGLVKGYLARPKGDGPFPAIVVVHEWWGLAEWIKENTERLAAKGYVALAVDLYRSEERRVGKEGKPRWAP